MPPDGNVKTHWDRVIELWYETFDDWRRAVVTDAARLHPARVGHAGRPTRSSRPYEELASTFILERPNDDFLRDLRGYVP